MTEVMPDFRLERPGTLAEAITALASPDARIIAGGTDLLVQMRMGLGAPALLVDLSQITSLQKIGRGSDGLRIGAGVALAELEKDPLIITNYPAIAQAAAAIAGPSHRNIATVGGNLCLDTRCLYFNQSDWWRKSNEYCLKYQGDTCHVAPNGNRCRAAFSGDLAPAMMVHRASLEITGQKGTRHVELKDFYQEDGADYMTLKAGEIVTAIHIPPPKGPSLYKKIRLRGAVDFPLAGVAVASEECGGSLCLRVALTGTNSKPKLLEFADIPSGDREACFNDVNKAVQKAVSPQRTTSVAPHYRRLSIAAMAERLARELA